MKVKVLNADAVAGFTEVRWDLDFIKDKALSYSAYLVNTLIPLSEKDFATVVDAMNVDKKILAGAKSFKSLAVSVFGH